VTRRLVRGGLVGGAGAILAAALWPTGQAVIPAVATPGGFAAPPTLRLAPPSAVDTPRAEPAAEAEAATPPATTPAPVSTTTRALSSAVMSATLAATPRATPPRTTTRPPSSPRATTTPRTTTRPPSPRVAPPILTPAPVPPASTPTACPATLAGTAGHVARAGYALAKRFGVPVTSILGVGSRGNASDHPSGFALDFMVGPAIGNPLAEYVLAHQKELGVSYVIYRQRYNDGRGWSTMEDRGSPTANHMDHVHVSFARVSPPTLVPC
jgi:hypothetical protein